MSQFNFTSALTQINKLQAELIQTDKVLKETLQDYIPKNVELLLNTLIGSSIPNLLLEIGCIVKSLDFQNIFEGGAVIDNTNEISVDIKEEIIIGNVSDDEDFINDNYQDPLEQNNSEPAVEPQQNGETSTNKFIIDGSNGVDRRKSLENFVALCLQVPGTKETIMKHKGPDKGYLCPYCEPPANKMSCNKPSSFLRHIIRSHDTSPLIPLPFWRKKTIKEDNKQKEENKAAASTIQSLSKNSFGQYDLTGSREEKARKLNLFVSLCIRIPEACHKLVAHKSLDGSFSCPHCHLMGMSGPSKFMVHLVRSHQDSGLIPLPFVRPAYTAKVIRPVEPKGIKEKEKLKEEVADPLATTTTEQSGPTAGSPFVINNEKTLNQFVGACLNFPGVRDHLHMIVYKEADDGKKGFYCPHCEERDRYMIQSIRDLMRHVIRNHPDSEHIPLPFVRQLKLKMSGKKRKREERVESANEEMNQKDDDAKRKNASNSKSTESEFILGLS